MLVMELTKNRLEKSGNPVLGMAENPVINTFSSTVENKHISAADPPTDAYRMPESGE